MQDSGKSFQNALQKCLLTITIIDMVLLKADDYIIVNQAVTIFFW